MTNFQIQYNSCSNSNNQLLTKKKHDSCRETDLEIKIPKTTQTSLRKATRVKLEL